MIPAKSGFAGAGFLACEVGADDDHVVAMSIARKGDTHLCVPLRADSTLAVPLQEWGQLRVGDYVLYKPTRMNMAKPIPPGSLAALDDVFFQPFVKLVPVDIDIAMRARVLVRETVGLKKKAEQSTLHLRCVGTSTHSTLTMSQT